MRISDWSSDVCSSDLVGGLFAIPAQRVESYYLGFVTLAAGLAFEPLIRQMSWITGGIRGINATVPSLKVPFAGALTPLAVIIAFRSEERRVGKECVSPCRS